MFSKHKPAGVPADHAASSSAQPLRPAGADASRGVVRSATIGAHTRIEGSVIGDEELIIDGEVIGTVEFKRNTVTVGNAGRVQGDITAQTLHVAGSVEGRLIASHKITVHHTAHVVGTIICPCLVLEDGAVFQGSIDMDAENDTLLDAFGDTPPKVAGHAPHRDDEMTGLDEQDETPLDDEEEMRRDATP